MSVVPGRLTHAYIIEARALHAANELAASMLCTGDGDRPCRVCQQCRKTFAGVHPDLINITRLPGSNGTIRREIVVDQIRGMIADAPILPNDAERKVYIIQDADSMNVSAQNAMLKLLEEPPNFCCFILVAENVGSLLPTVRSRCIELYENLHASVDYGCAEDFLEIVESGDLSELLLFCNTQAALPQGETVNFLNGATALLTDLLSNRKSSKLPPEQGLKLVRLLSRCEAMINSNVATRHVWGLISARTFSNRRPPA